MGVGSNWQAEGRISVSSSCKRRRAGATEICSGERRRRRGDRGGWRWYYTVGQQRGSSSCPASRGEVAVERVDMRQNGVGVEERLVDWYR